MTNTGKIEQLTTTTPGERALDAMRHGRVISWAEAMQQMDEAEKRDEARDNEKRQREIWKYRIEEADSGFDAYQGGAAETAIYPNIGSNPIYPTLGLCGEAGEVAERVKKVLRDNGGMFDNETRVAIAKELGDVLWYIAQLATELGLSLGDIARDNLAKLADRQARGQLGGSGDER